MNVSFRYAVTSKVISVSPVEGVGLPKTETSQKKTAFRSRSIDTQKTLTMEQVLRSTYCTLLLKEEFNPKAVSKLMGHAKELITMDVYADNREIIADGVPEIEEYMKMVLPNMEENELFKNELLEIVVDVTEFLPRTA